MNRIIVLRLLRYRRNTVLLLATIVASVSLLLTTFNTIHASGERAVEESTRSAVAHSPFSVQVIRHDALQKVSAANLEPLSRSQITIISTGRRAPSEDITTRSTVDAWTLIKGSRPSKNSQIALSSALADALNVGIGDGVTVDNGDSKSRLTVTGIVIDSNNTSALQSIRVNPRLQADQATIWLSQNDPYSVSSLRPLLDKRAITEGATNSLTRHAIAVENARKLSVFTSSAQLILAVGSLLFLLLCAAGFSLASSDVEGLVASGMKVRKAWLLVIGSYIIAIAFSLVGGAFLGAVLTSFAATRISASLGQFWSKTSIAWSSSGSFAAVIFLGGILTGLAILLVKKAREISFVNLTIERFNANSLVRLSRPAFACSLSLLILVWIHLLPYNFAAPSGLVAAASGGVLASTLSIRILSAGKPALTHFLQHLYAPLIIVGILCSSIAFIGSHSATQKIHQLAESTALTHPPQPHGSLAITEIPNEAAREVANVAKSLGAGDIKIYALPQEGSTMWRVIPGGAAACAKRSGAKNVMDISESCMNSKAASDLNTIAISTSDRSLSSADPALLKAGRLDIVQVDTTGAILRTEVAQINSSDPNLGGNLPGLVIGESSDLAKKLDLHPSESRTVLINGFSNLSASRQARIRNLVAQVGPASQVAEDSSADQEVLKQTARWTAIFGGLLSGLSFVIAGLYLLETTAQSWGSLYALNVSREIQSGLRGWFMIPLSFGVSSAIFAYSTSYVTAEHVSFGFDLWWITPVPCLGITALVLWLRRMRFMSLI